MITFLCASTKTPVVRKVFDLNCIHTLVFVCWQQTFNCFEDWVYASGLFSFVALYDTRARHECAELTRIENVVFVYAPDLHDDSIYKYALAPNSLLFNSEQMSIEQRRQPIVDFVNSGGRIVNYSRQNQALLHERVSKLADAALYQYHVPYNTHPNTDEQIRLRKLLANTVKLYDFAFVGALTPRRKEILAKITSTTGKRIDVITHCFGDERDGRIAACRALLNLHASDDYTVYEALRCERWRAAGLPILSEACVFASAEWIPTDGIVFAKLHTLYATVEQWNPSLFTSAPQSAPSLHQFSQWIDRYLRHLDEDVVGHFPFRARYGTDAKQCDVTLAVISLLLSADKKSICIPPQVRFNDCFTDVMPNQLKKLRLDVGKDADVCAELSEQRGALVVLHLPMQQVGIPQTIVQYWDDFRVPLPQWASERSAQLRSHHPQYAFKLFNRRLAHQFIAANFDTPVLQAFDKCNLPSMRCDFFRYCYLFALGGVYADQKTVCKRPFLDDYRQQQRQHEIVLTTRKHELLYNGFIASRPKVDALRRVVEQCTENILKETHRQLYPTTGTPVLTAVCKEVYGSDYSRAGTAVATIDHDQVDAPIHFAAADYADGKHWHIEEQHRSIYRKYNLQKALGVDQIYVLNLDRREDRLDECRQQMRNLGVSYDQWIRWSAVDGHAQENIDALSETQAEWRQRFFSKPKVGSGEQRYLAGAFGCLLSHVQIIYHAQKQNYRRILILEDDFAFTSRFSDERLLKKIASTACDMMYLQMSHKVAPLDTADPEIKQLRSTVAAGAYIVNSSLYERILNDAMPYAMQIDVFYAEVLQKEYRCLGTYCNLIVQREGFSDIVQKHVRYTF